MKEKINPLRLLLKTTLAIALVAFILVPLIGDSIGKVSLYNTFFPGRSRLPYSDYPEQAYNLSLYNLEAMFASHQVSKHNPQTSAYRVFILGDSSVWGTLLEPADTIAGQLDRLELTGPGEAPVHFYNLGYPTLSLTKDLLLLDKALDYDPDLIIWMITLESFPADKQLTSPLVENNSAAISRLIAAYHLEPVLGSGRPQERSYWERTLFGQRRNLADIFRLQLYGVMWAITGIDQYYPPDYEKAARDLTEDKSYHGWNPGEMTEDDLTLGVLLAGKQAADEVPILIVNEPILISEGLNSDIRYNFYYPRWAYDQYRQMVNEFSQAHDLNYLDTWDIVPESYFTNTAIHTNPAGVRILAESLIDPVLEVIQLEK